MQPNQGPPSLPPPMWCPDPAGSNRLRWWDGSKWTDQYAQIPASEPSVSAVPAVSGSHDSSPITAYGALPVKTTRGPAPSPLADIVAAARLEEVVGETYRTKDIRRVFKESGMPITERGVTLNMVRCILVPEPWNEHDPNAVAVMVGQNHVGYLAAELA